VVTEEQVLVDRRRAPLVDVHVDVTGRRADQAVARLADAQFVPGSEELVEVRGLGGDVRDGDHDVDDRFRSQAGDGGGADVLDDRGVRAGAGEGLQDATAVLLEDRSPPGVGRLETHGDRFRATDDLDRGDVLSGLVRVVVHSAMMAACRHEGPDRPGT
jgi:hypothetical protein